MREEREREPEKAREREKPLPAGKNNTMSKNTSLSGFDEGEASFITHFDYPEPGAYLCADDGILRTGIITDMPFIGNEHQPATLKTEDGSLYAVDMSEIISRLGKDPRRF